MRREIFILKKNIEKSLVPSTKKNFPCQICQNFAENEFIYCYTNALHYNRLDFDFRVGKSISLFASCSLFIVEPMIFLKYFCCIVDQIDFISLNVCSVADISRCFHSLYNVYIQKIFLSPISRFFFSVKVHCYLLN